MSLFIASLNSGSNGNCYYIGNDTEAVLVDTGLSCKETEKRMQHLGLSMNKVKAIFISHEHSDHIKGLQAIAEKYKLPVYITDITLRHSGIIFSPGLARPFTAHEPVEVGSLSVTPFPKYHDAQDPHSFVISCCGITVGVFTDIGSVCSHVKKNFSLCHAAFLEANYDEVLLETGRYPLFLKNRIRSGKGHLSNSQALEIFLKNRPPFMTHLFLSHISRDNNCPVKAKQLFDGHAKLVSIIVASRYEQTAVYAIEKKGEIIPGIRKRKVAFNQMQLSLFEEGV